MKYEKKRLMAIARQVMAGQPLTPAEISYFQAFEKLDKDSSLIVMLKKIALPASLVVGCSLAIFAGWFDPLIAHLPHWTNLTPEELAGLNYFWNLFSDPIEQPNIVYHIPNLVLYSFGIVGVKNLVDRIERQSWLDRVMTARDRLRQQVKDGELPLQLKKGHSMLFVGNGDFIATQFVLNHQPEEAVTLSQSQPDYTISWNCYDLRSIYEDMKEVIVRAGGHNAGEYIFFPVQDDQIFLPNDKAYDLSPHKLDILCRNIRKIEKERRWRSKRIIIVGDKFHSSFVQSEDQRRVIPNSQDVISLESIVEKYDNISLFDPTDIVLKKILKIARGRRIIFRATKEGIAEYKTRFYQRLKMLGYKPTARGNLTIGYDIYEDQTEQQTLVHKLDNYYPVVLSQPVRDTLLRDGLEPDEFLYVPDLVLDTISLAADQQ